MRLPALVLACLFLIVSPALAQRLDETPRTAVISAFPPEIGALNAATADQKAFEVNGVRFMTGRLEGKPVVVFLSGVSMVNAAMTTQMALDHFNITRIVFSGIAGGVDEGLDIGDVVVADQWAQNLESAFARETDKGFEVQPGIRTTTLANYGMIYPRGIHMPGDALGTPARVWFPADPALLAAARKVAGEVALRRCDADKCLVHPPKVVVAATASRPRSSSTTPPIANTCARPSRPAWSTWRARPSPTSPWSTRPRLSPSAASPTWPAAARGPTRCTLSWPWPRTIQRRW